MQSVRERSPLEMSQPIAIPTIETTATTEPKSLVVPGSHDLDLVQRAMRREPAARREIEERFVVVLRFMHAIDRRHHGGSSAEDLEDLAHDALTLALGKLASFNGVGTLETWLYGYCVNVYANDRRRRFRRRPASELESARTVAVDNTNIDIERAAEQDHVHRALRLLGPPANDIIRLHVFDDLPFPEVSRAMNLALGTVKTLYYRGIERLTELLGRERNA